MKREKVVELLRGTGIPLEDEKAVPVNGAARRLPYMVIRTEEKDEGSDNGRVSWAMINWIVSLFTANKDFALECKIRKALTEVGSVEVARYPDGEPYQTNFTFKTKGVHNG